MRHDDRLGRQGDRAYWSGESRLKQAEDDLKAAMIRGKAWSEATTRQTTAAEALDAARTALADNAHRRTLLERVRRVAPHLQKLQQVSVQIDELVQVPLLPQDAEELLRKVEQKLASTAQTIMSETARREVADQDMKAAPLDAQALALEQDIKGLGVQRAGVARHGVDVSKRGQEADALEAAALRDAARLRLAAGDVAALRMALPAAELRKALAAQAVAYTGKSSNLTATLRADTNR
ncbi:MAG: hypothetical protein ACT4P0_03060 [Panacagrimonas sp.]